jgi:hypothetical protein
MDDNIAPIPNQVKDLQARNPESPQKNGQFHEKVYLRLRPMKALPPHESK